VTIRVFIVDDYEIVLRGLRGLLEAADDIEVVGEALTAKDAMSLVPVVRPDVAMLDVFLSDGDGIELCRELRSSLPQLKCIMLTGFNEDKALLSATMAGASAYLLKDVKGFDLVSVVRRVAAGKSLLNQDLARKLLARKAQRQDDRMQWLTPQQRNILDLIAQAKTNRQIATELSLKEKTVKNYVSELLSKMGFSHRTEAAVYAIQAAVQEKRRSGQKTQTGISSLSERR